MAVIRSRYIFWLIKAYIKRWGKLFLVFFFLGLLIFFLILRFSSVFIRYIPLERKTIIGLTGTYTTDTMPDIIIKKVSRGLTKIEEDGSIKPDLANNWNIENEGRKYTFYLKKNLRFTDGTPFISKNITYSFSNVKISRPDDYTIVFDLKNKYAPFLVTVAKPIFYKGYIGIGDYTINNIDLNGSFLKTVQLLSTTNRFKTELYVFYPTNESLKVAFTLGEVTRIVGLSDITVRNTSLQSYPNIQIEKKINYKQLVTLFYNTQDPLLSDKKIRNGLSYALPESFNEGLRVYRPYSPVSYYDNPSLSDRKQDINHAKLLLDSAKETSSMSALPKIQIKTLSKYKNVANNIKNEWKKANVNATVEEVDTVPQSFQIYLGDFNVPKDPDQYSLWHSAQDNNISHLKNLRIDKLLEDGREKINTNERLKIYADFQKYLVDEAPAAFLYFPYEYELVRK